MGKILPNLQAEALRRNRLLTGECPPKILMKGPQNLDGFLEIKTEDQPPPPAHF